MIKDNIIFYYIICFAIIAAIITAIIYSKPSKYPEKCSIVSVKSVPNPGTEVTFVMPKNYGYGSNITGIKYIYLSFNQVTDSVWSTDDAFIKSPRINLETGDIEFLNDGTYTNVAPEFSNNVVDLFTQKYKVSGEYAKLNENIVNHSGEAIKWNIFTGTKIDNSAFSLANSGNPVPITIKINMPYIFLAGSATPYINLEIGKFYGIQMWIENNEGFQSSKSKTNVFEFKNKTYITSDKQFAVNWTGATTPEKTHTCFIRDNKLECIEEGFGENRVGIYQDKTYSLYSKRIGSDTITTNTEFNLEQIWDGTTLANIKVKKIITNEDYLFFLFDFEDTPDDTRKGYLAYSRKVKNDLGSSTYVATYSEVVILTDAVDKTYKTNFSELDLIIVPRLDTSPQINTDRLKNLLDIGIYDNKICVIEETGQLLLFILSSSPTSDTFTFQEFVTPRKYRNLVSDGNTICAINTDNKIECWGYDTVTTPNLISTGDATDGTSEDIRLMSIYTPTATPNNPEITYINQDNIIKYGRINNNTFEEQTLETELNGKEFNRSFIGNNSVCALKAGSNSEQALYSDLICNQGQPSFVTTQEALQQGIPAFEDIHFEYVAYPNDTEKCVIGNDSSKQRIYCWDNTENPPIFTRIAELGTHSTNIGWGEPSEIDITTNLIVDSSNELLCPKDKGTVNTETGECECNTGYYGNTCSFEISDNS